MQWKKDFNIGFELFRKGKCRDAINAFTRAIGQNSKFLEAYYYRGLCHTNLGQKGGFILRVVRDPYSARGIRD